MAKFFGPIGYTSTTETSPGIWTEVITEYNYYGDVTKNVSKVRSGDGLNDNVVIENQLSILADEFAYSNFQSIRYAKWMGGLWKITSVNVQRPRLILTIGEVYNGPVPIPEDIPDPDPIGGDED